MLQIGFLRLSCKVGWLGQWQKFLEFANPSPSSIHWNYCNGRYSYDFGWLNSAGTGCYWSPLDGENNQGWMTVEIKQSYIESWRQQDYIDFFKLLSRSSARLTRIDISVDDYKHLKKPSQIRSELLSYQIAIPRLKTLSGIEKNMLASTPVAAGETCYIGSRSSGKFGRIYDKNAESKGAVNAIRYEAELKEDYARDLSKKIETLHVDMLCEWLDNPSLHRSEYCLYAAFLDKVFELLAQSLKTTFDFRIADGDPPSARPRNFHQSSKIPSWAKSIFGLLERIKFDLPKRQPSLARFANWLINSVFPGLALYLRVLAYYKMLPNAWLHANLEQAPNKWGRNHRIMLEQAMLSSPVRPMLQPI